MRIHNNNISAATLAGGKGLRARFSPKYYTLGTHGERSHSIPRSIFSQSLQRRPLKGDIFYGGLKSVHTHAELGK